MTPEEKYNKYRELKIEVGETPLTYEQVCEKISVLKHEYNHFWNDMVADKHNRVSFLSKINALHALDIFNEETSRNIPYEHIDILRRQEYEYAGDMGETTKAYFKVFNTLKVNIHKNKVELRISNGEEICSRCGGSGHYSYNQITGTTCFNCNGRGTVKGGSNV